jgi:hypothetical protein
MRRKENRRRTNRLFILGAGASYSCSARAAKDSLKIAPLDMGLCKRLCDLDPAKPHWVAESRDLVQSNWMDEGEFRSMGLEQAIIRQLGHLEFVDAIHRRRRAGSVDVYAWLSHITHLMCYALRHAKENSADTYAAFASKLKLDVPLEEHADRVVTFNYDDMFDQHLLAKHDAVKVYFDRIKASPDDSDRRDAQHPFPMLVKLHGSVNWRCRDSDFEKIIKGARTPADPEWLDPVWIASVGTPKPDESVYPLMIPPLPVKPITSISLFQYLWTVAYEYLHEAQDIVVCGYSLPDADRLAWSLFGNFSNKGLKTVTVIDPNPAVLTKWRALFKRKSVAVARWEYFDDFTAYVDQMPATT